MENLRDRPAWAALTDHYTTLHARHLRELFAEDPGRGERLAADLERLAPRHVVYSSCNPATLARDLATMSGYRVARGQLFDMFPQTGHAEVLVLLRRIEIQRRA